MKEYLCEMAQLDNRSVAAQLRGHGDERAAKYEAFLRKRGLPSGMIETEGGPLDIYAASVGAATTCSANTAATEAQPKVLAAMERVLARMDAFEKKHKLSEPTEVTPSAFMGAIIIGGCFWCMHFATPHGGLVKHAVQSVLY